MALIKVTDRDGIEHDVDGNTKFTLMENLRDLEYGVAAVCGGMCACATCHVWVDPEWQPKLPPQHSDEKDLLSDLSDQPVEGDGGSADEVSAAVFETLGTLVKFVDEKVAA